MSSIHQNAVVHPTAKIDESAEIGPNCVVMENVEIGANSKLIANVFIGKDTVIGQGNTFFPNCTIGCRPQILGSDENTAVGKLIIGDNNTIREQVTIHPAMHAEAVTSIGSNNLIMIGVHIGHDCIIEDNIIMSNFSQISGHCHIEQGVWFSGMVMIHQFVTVGKWCYAAGLSGLNHDFPPYMIISGHYPSKVRGVNKRGLSRAGLDETAQKNVRKAHKYLYRTPGSLSEKAEQLEKESWIDQSVREIIESIKNSNKHRFGRYLETFR